MTADTALSSLALEIAMMPSVSSVFKIQIRGGLPEPHDEVYTVRNKMHKVEAVQRKWHLRSLLEHARGCGFTFIFYFL